MQMFATNDDLLKENNVLLFIPMGGAWDQVPPPPKSATGLRTEKISFYLNAKIEKRNIS